MHRELKSITSTYYFSQLTKNALNFLPLFVTCFFSRTGRYFFYFFEENLRDYLAEENLKNEIPSIKVSKIAHLDITSNGEALGTIDIGLFGDQARHN